MTRKKVRYLPFHLKEYCPTNDRPLQLPFSKQDVRTISFRLKDGEKRQISAEKKISLDARTCQMLLNCVQAVLEFKIFWGPQTPSPPPPRPSRAFGAWLARNGTALHGIFVLGPPCKKILDTPLERGTPKYCLVLENGLKFKFTCMHCIQKEVGLLARSHLLITILFTKIWSFVRRFLEKQCKPQKTKLKLVSPLKIFSFKHVL